MKSIKLQNILLSIIAINLTLITLIQIDWFPKKANANSNNVDSINTNYGLVPLNENGEIEVELNPDQLEVLKSSIYDDESLALRLS